MGVSLLETRTKTSRPSELEFTKETILAGLRNNNFCCERCGIHKKDTPEGYLQAHHRVAIFFVVKYFPQLPAEIVRSIANLEILCVDCHKESHSLEDYHVYKQIAVGLLGFNTFA